MRRSGAWALVGAALLVVGGAAGLLLQGPGGAGGGGSDDPRAGAREALVPTLSGARRAGPSPEGVPGAFPLAGLVVDERGAPAAGVPVEARRLPPEAAGPSTVARLAASFEGELERCFAPPEPPEVTTVTVTAVSAADGSFALVVPQSGRYRVAAVPPIPAGGDATYVTAGESEATRLRLETWAGAALRGRVLDAEDRPVAATLVASHDVEDEAEHPTRRWTDPATGAFAFEGLHLGRTRLEVLVPGRLRFTGWRGVLPAASEVLVRLGPERALIEGRVTNPAGQPIEGARVAADVEETALPAGRSDVVDPRLLAVTDAAGVYRLRGAFTGTVERVLAWAPGHLGYLATPPEAPWSGLKLASGTAATLDLVLYRGGVLTGRVLEQGSHAPLAGAVVHVLPAVVDARVEKPQGAQATSDAAGHYRVEGLPVGRCVLAVEHPTHFLAAQAALHVGEAEEGEWDVSVARPDALAPAMTVFLGQDGAQVEHDLELVRGLPVEGQVLDPDGHGVEGAEVRWAGEGLARFAWGWGASSGTEERALAVSDPEGRFRVGGLPAGEHWVLCARKDPWIGAHGEAFALRPGASAPALVLRLVRPAVVVGRVVDAAGAPVAGAAVSAWSREEAGYDDAGPSPHAWSASDGSFRLEGTPLGSVSVYARSDDRGYADAELRGLEPGSTRGDVLLTLERGGTAEVSGVLLLPSGLPARGKTLKLHSKDHPYETVETRGDGTFLGHVGEGPVSVQRDDTGAELAAVTAPAIGLRLVYEPHAEVLHVVEGLIVDPDGRPVPCCEVRITREETASEGSTFFSSDGTHVANGYFRRSVDQTPPLVLEVLRPEDGAGQPLNLRPARLALAEFPAAPLEVVLERGAEVRGRVVDGEGRGVEGARVSAGEITALTDVSGRFSLGGLGAEELSVAVLPPPPWTQPMDQRVVPGAESPTFALRRGLALAGQVLDARGRPLRQVQVTLDWPAAPALAGGARRVGPDRSGRFRFEALPEEAPLTVGVQPWSRSESEVPSQAPLVLHGVRAGREDLRLVVPDAVSVEGLVVDAAGRPVHEGYVYAYDPVLGVERDSLALAEVSGEGTFRLVGLAPGPVLLQVSREDGGEAHVPLTVEAPATGVRLVYPPTKPIAGRLVGATDPTAFRVWAWAVEAEGRELRSVGVLPDGRFALDAVGTRGRWMVAARADADDRYALEGPFDPGTGDVRLALRPGASLEGSVATGDGAPLPERITVRVWGQHVGATVEADDRGRWRVRGLPPGRYVVQASTPSNRYRDVEEQEVEAGRAGLTLVLPPHPPGSGGGSACGKK